MCSMANGKKLAFSLLPTSAAGGAAVNGSACDKREKPPVEGAVRG